MLGITDPLAGSSDHLVMHATLKACRLETWTKVLKFKEAKKTPQNFTSLQLRG